MRREESLGKERALDHTPRIHCCDPVTIELEPLSFPPCFMTHLMLRWTSALCDDGS